MEKRTQWFISKSFTCHKGWKVNSIWDYNLKNLRINLKNKENWSWAKKTESNLSSVSGSSEGWQLLKGQWARSWGWQPGRVGSIITNKPQSHGTPVRQKSRSGQVFSDHQTNLWWQGRSEVQLGSRVRKARLGSARYMATPCQHWPVHRQLIPNAVEEETTDSVGKVTLSLCKKLNFHKISPWGCIFFNIPPMLMKAIAWMSLHGYLWVFFTYLHCWRFTLQ